MRWRKNILTSYFLVIPFFIALSFRYIIHEMLFRHLIFRIDVLCESIFGFLAIFFKKIALFFLQNFLLPQLMAAPCVKWSHLKLLLSVTD